MNRLLWTAAALMSLFAGACGENQSPVISERVPPPAPTAAQTSVQPAGMTAAPLRVPDTVSGAPVPPPGAQWTIFCGSFSGPDHVLVANQAKQDLIRQSHLNGWYLVHHADESILYYGYYTELGTPRAKADKRAIEALSVNSGDKEFAASMFVPLSSPNPSAPPEWDLANTPADMYFSLQIAAFVQTPDHKERAVEAVREARKEGIEAYYYHTDSMSTVCVGAWPRSAVHQQAGGGVAHNNNADVPVIVANQEIPDGAIPNLHDANGNPIPVIAPKLEIEDPTLAKAIHDFPENAVNGYVMTQKDKNGNPFPAPSFLVEIPHNSDAAAQANNADAGEPAPAQPAPVDGTDATLGKLGGH
jgi:hypothetical protein